MNSIKGFLKTFKQGYKRYRTLNHRLDGQTQMKTVLKSTFGSIGISLLLVLIPTLVIINMFIYSKLTVILGVLLFLVAVVFIMLYYIIYYQLLSNYHPQIKNLNLKFLIKVEISIILSIMLFTALVLILALL